MSLLSLFHSLCLACLARKCTRGLDRFHFNTGVVKPSSTRDTLAFLLMSLPFLCSYTHTHTHPLLSIIQFKLSNQLHVLVPTPFLSSPILMLRIKVKRSFSLSQAEPLLFPNTTHTFHHILSLPPLHPSFSPFLPMVAPRSKHPPMRSCHQLI